MESGNFDGNPEATEASVEAETVANLLNEPSWRTLETYGLDDVRARRITDGDHWDARDAQTSRKGNGPNSTSTVTGFIGPEGSEALSAWLRETPRRQKPNPRFEEISANVGKAVTDKETIAPPRHQPNHGGSHHTSTAPAKHRQIAGSSFPDHSVAARQGPRLADELEDLAFAVAKADLIVIDFNLLYVQSGNQRTEQGKRFNDFQSTSNVYVPPVAKQKLRRVAIELPEYRAQLEDCLECSEDFHRDYLSTKVLLEYWEVHRRVQKANIDEGIVNPAMVKTDVSDVLGTKTGEVIQQLYKKTMHNPNVAFTKDGIINPQFRQLEDSCEPMKKHLKFAIQRKLITDEQKSLICKRFAVLDDIFQSLDVARSSRVFARKTESWPTLAESIGLPIARTGSKDWASFMMWATLILSAMGSLPTFALGLKYSEPKHGKTTDSDFWFLLQTCLASFLGIMTLAIPIFQNDVLQGLNKVVAWGSIAIATSCLIAAPFLYLLAPTAWATMLTIVAGMFQAWLVVQIAIEAKDHQNDMEGKYVKTE